ncbi:MAG: tRNA-intron lyase [Methanomicrobium sp.]|nr:tRNA-intron lyase [Methanomicrobium sp.]
MIGEYDGEWINLGEDGLILYEQGGYGRPVQSDGRTTAKDRDADDKAGKTENKSDSKTAVTKTALRLSPEEALYLIGREKITVKDYTYDELLTVCTEKSEFLRKFLVYRDIRERGFVIQSGPHDFRVFKRGQKPGTGTSFYTMRVLSERDLVVFQKVIEETRTARNMRKQLILAVGDDENEITYYEVKSVNPPEGVSGFEFGKVKGKVMGNTVILHVNPESEYEKVLFGTRLDGERLSLSPAEALYLTDRGILELEEDRFDAETEEKSRDDTENGCKGVRPVTREEYFGRVTGADHELAYKIKAYSHLRDLKNIPRTAYKFGHHFRVYSGGTQHSELLVHAIPVTESMPMSVVSRSVRLAHSVRKKMLFACVNTDNIEYIEFARVKM